MAPIAPVHHVARSHEVRAGGGMRQRSFCQQLDRLVIQDMEMLAVDPGHAAMAMAHVFAQANIRDYDQLRASGLDRANGLLHDAVFPQ